MNKERIYLSPPDLTGEENKHISEVLKSNWIAPIGPHLDLFEEKIADYTGYKYALAVNSGTSAIHLSLLCHGIKASDVVISSSMTFCGAVNPVLYLDAIPFLLDSTFTDWNIDVELLESHLQTTDKKPKAILVTHLFGMPADIKRIEAIGQAYGIPVIHDLAEAIGSRQDNKKPGQISESAILSFNGNKLITTGGGGALLTNNIDHYKKGLLLSTQAKTQGYSYNHAELGYNYRMSNVLAGLGLGQFSAIDSKIEKKRVIFDYYRNHLQHIEGIKFQEEKNGSFSDRWLTAIYFDPTVFAANTVENIIEGLAEHNIESRYIWKPMHLQPLYKKFEVIGGSVSESLFSSGICLPSGTGLKRSDQDRIIEIVINRLKVCQ